MSRKRRPHAVQEEPDRQRSDGRPLVEGVPVNQLYPREIRHSPEIVMLSAPRSSQAEQFRRLRNAIVNHADAYLRTVVVTSSIPGEGKTTVALNLALAFAAGSAEKTLLIDADMRRPRVMTMLSPEPSVGLSEVLAGRVHSMHAILSAKNSELKILPAGKPIDSPLELIASDACEELFRTLAEEYDRIVVDTPPSLPFTDADAIGAHSDGFLLVARAGLTPAAVLLRAQEGLGAAPVLGTVLNATTSVSGRVGDQYAKYYDEYYRDGSKS